MNDEIRKLRTLKDKLKQITKTPALTDYYMRWKEQRIKEIQLEIDEIKEKKSK